MSERAITILAAVILLAAIAVAAATPWGRVSAQRPGIAPKGSGLFTPAPLPDGTTP